MIAHLCGPENTEAHAAAVEALAQVIHEGDWALGGSNGGGDWRWHRATDQAKQRARAKAEAVLRSDELATILRPALADTWQRGINDFAATLLRPLDEHGMRPAPVNPYTERPDQPTSPEPAEHPRSHS